MKLIDYNNKSIKRGSVFRLPAVWPYEEWVDFMVIDLFETHGLVVSSGHKAGLILISLPIESASTEGRALSKNGLLPIGPNGFILTVMLKMFISSMNM